MAHFNIHRDNNNEFIQYHVEPSYCIDRSVGCDLGVVVLDGFSGQSIVVDDDKWLDVNNTSLLNGSPFFKSQNKSIADLKLTSSGLISCASE